MWQLAQAQAGWIGLGRAAAAAAVAAALLAGPAAAGPAASVAASSSCSFLAISDADRAASSTSGGGPALPLPLWEGEAARMLLASGRLGLPARRGRGSSEGGAEENRLKRLAALALLPAALVQGMAAAAEELLDGLRSTAAVAQAVSLTTASPSLAGASDVPQLPSSVLHRGVPAKLPRLLMLDLPMEDSPHE